MFARPLPQLSPIPFPTSPFFRVNRVPSNAIYIPPDRLKRKACGGTTEHSHGFGPGQGVAKMEREPLVCADLVSPAFMNTEPYCDQYLFVLAWPFGLWQPNVLCRYVQGVKILRYCHLPVVVFSSKSWLVISRGMSSHSDRWVDAFPNVKILHSLGSGPLICAERPDAFSYSIFLLSTT